MKSLALGIVGLFWMGWGAYRLFVPSEYLSLLGFEPGEWWIPGALIALVGFTYILFALVARVVRD